MFFDKNNQPAYIAGKTANAITAIFGKSVIPIPAKLNQSKADQIKEYSDEEKDFILMSKIVSTNVVVRALNWLRGVNQSPVE